jgi:Heavy-metal resistance
MCAYPSRAALAVLILIAAGAAAGAQTQPAGPYAGLQTRAIKALSDQEIADLTAGRGMGTALPAELNSYPGPTHVLEYADQLGLTEQQRAEVKQLFDAMKAEAIPLGQKLIAAERELDRDFAQRTITPERLKATIAAIAEIRGELRNTHLKYHLSTAALLGPDQIRRYAELRGYGTGSAASAAAVPSVHPHMRHD